MTHFTIKESYDGQGDYKQQVIRETELDISVAA
jgi:hypothetical protein